MTPSIRRSAQPRIGIDARLGAYRAGGIAQHVAGLIEGLAALAPEETVVVLAHRRAAGSQSWPFETRYLRTPPHHRLEGLALPVELLGCRLRLLHSPDVVVPIAWRGPCVATVHDLDFLRHPERLTGSAAAYYRGVHRSVRQADRVIAVSEYTSSELTRFTEVDPDKVRVVPNALSDRFRQRFDQTSDGKVLEGLGLNRPYILYVSTIEPRKNVATLLRAFAVVSRQRHDVDLVLAGGRGWLSDEVYALADELGLGRRARFLGYVAGSDLAALYRGAELLAHPAWDEGFGLTPLEAAACGTPVVASRAGALPEILGPAALYVPPDEPADWAAALRRLLDDPTLRAQLAAAGRERARRFTPDRQARLTLDVYREALGAAGAGGGLPADPRGSA